MGSEGDGRDYPFTEQIGRQAAGGRIHAYDGRNRPRCSAGRLVDRGGHVEGAGAFTHRDVDYVAFKCRLKRFRLTRLFPNIVVLKNRFDFSTPDAPLFTGGNAAAIGFFKRVGQVWNGRKIAECRHRRLFDVRARVFRIIDVRHFLGRERNCRLSIFRLRSPGVHCRGLCSRIRLRECGA